VGWVSAVDREYFKKIETLKGSGRQLAALISRILHTVYRMLHNKFYGNTPFHCMEGEHANEKLMSQLISIHLDAYK
jgi:hypothetical protein